MPSPQGNGHIDCYLARPSAARGKLPAILVVHENRGLNPYVKDVARRLAKAGYIPLSPAFQARVSSAVDAIGAVGPPIPD